MLLKVLRSPRFKIIAGVSVALAGIAVVGAKCTVDGQWQEMERKVAGIRAELDVVRNVREPLGGPATEGNAWDSYDKAIEWLREDGGSFEYGSAAQTASNTGGDLRRTEAVRLGEKLEEVLALVQRGARCRDATQEVEGSAGEAPPPARLTHSRMLVEVLTLTGLVDIEAGRVVLGCAKILDALQFGQDLACSPMLISQMVGTSQMVPHALKQYLAIEGVGALPKEAVRILEAGVGKLIERAPVHVDWKGDFVVYGNLSRGEEAGSLLGVGDVPGGPLGDLVARYLIADSMLTFSQAMEGAENLQGAAYGQRIQDLSGEFRESRNPILRRRWMWASAESSVRFNLVLASQLHRALRRSLKLPEVEFAKAYGVELIETDDGKVMTFRVEDVRNSTVELTVRY